MKPPRIYPDCGASLDPQEKCTCHEENEVVRLQDDLEKKSDALREEIWAGIRKDNPDIRDKPAVVCGDVKARNGIILVKNQIAKKYGIKTREALWQTKQKCPELVCVPLDYGLYIRFNKRIRRMFEEYSDRVESFGLDEAWIDLTNRNKTITDGECLAHEICERVKGELGITVSVGASYNKIFTRLGSEMKKPDAVTVIRKEDFREKVWGFQLRICCMWAGHPQKAADHQCADYWCIGPGGFQYSWV